MIDVKAKSILIVDDAPESISLYDNILHQYRILAATNCEEAIELVENGIVPDLIIADILLPGKNGFEFYQFVRSREEFQDIPFIFVSGMINNQVVQHSASGNVEFVGKPFTAQQLREVVENKLYSHEVDYV